VSYIITQLLAIVAVCFVAGVATPFLVRFVLRRRRANRGVRDLP